MQSYRRSPRLPLVALVVLASTAAVVTAVQDPGIAGKWFTAEAIQALLAGRWSTDGVATATPGTARRGPIDSLIGPGVRRDSPMPQPVEPGGPIFPGFPIRRFSPAAQQAAPTPQNEDAPRASADSLAIMLELAVDNESKLTGTVTFVVTDEKVAVEAGKLNGKTVTFNTTRRLSGNTTVTTWSGELTAQKTLTVRRASSTTSLPDLVFHRLQ